MEKLLKGNYEIKDQEKIEVSSQKKDSSIEFEDKAMERLGGSIAFVMKGKQFIWDDDDSE